MKFGEINLTPALSNLLEREEANTQQRLI